MIPPSNRPASLVRWCRYGSIGRLHPRTLSPGMSCRNSLFGLGATFCFALLSCRADAQNLQEGSEAAVPPPALQANLRKGEIVGIEQVRRAFLTFGTNEFVFVIPSGFRMDTSDSGKVVLSDANFDFYLTFRVANPTAGFR